MKPNGIGIFQARNGFDALQSTGFQAAQIAEWAAALYPQTGTDEAEVWALRGFEISQTKEACDTIIWHAVAAEMAIYPSAPIRGFLIDPEARVMLHVYDDRGMDVIAEDPAKLCAIRSTFVDWLLATNCGDCASDPCGRRATRR